MGIPLIPLTQTPAITIRQRRELAELIGFETRNKYEIFDESGRSIGFAAEQTRGLFGFIFRQIFGHWRRFNILIFSPDRQPVYRAQNRFRIWFTRVEIYDHTDRMLGSIQKRFSFLSKKFDIENEQGQVLMTVKSPFWKIWTFPVISDGVERAVIKKRWSGALTEVLLDKDNFRIEFNDSGLNQNQRALLLAAALFVDLEYFETKG